MKINFKTPISFRSIPIYEVKLKRQNSNGAYKELPVTFSKLKKNDPEDIKTIRKLSYAWVNTSYGKKITSNFLGYGPVCDEEDDFYAIEGYDRFGKKTIYSIAEINPTQRYVSYIQANPKNKDKGIKGSGEVILYGLGKKIGSNCFGEYYSLRSAYSAMGFYDQAGLIRDCDEFYLNKENAPQFFDRIEKKYNFNLEDKRTEQNED